MQYSIVIPAYNESRRIVPTLNKVLTYLAEQGWDAELIVVNDGSRDDTAGIVRRFVEKNSMMKLVENPGNRGKGYSVRAGMLNAGGDVVLFSDADLSSPIEEAAKLFQAIANGADVAIGSRWMKTELQTERQPLYRQLFGRLFNVMLRVVLGLKYKDTQCGFKAFTSRAARAVFPLQTIERWSFDPELIFLAQKQGFKVVEVPVQWAHDEKTTISPLRDGTRMFFEVLKIRWNAMTGKYAPRRAGSRAASL
ncbi:MAG TPA: dolichyl-phosphate beta-glucosyltransferase [Terriglobales bacterium]|nr:dolichyl-phosphate beta-glucosyltransferase [Terriglobales bacterium]